MRALVAFPFVLWWQDVCRDARTPQDRLMPNGVEQIWPDRSVEPKPARADSAHNVAGVGEIDPRSLATAGNCLSIA